jgi:hypothetical protein
MLYYQNAQVFLLPSLFDYQTQRFIGALSNFSNTLATFTGFFKGLQSTDSAISFRINALNVPFMNKLAGCWALAVTSLVFAAPLVSLSIKDAEEQSVGEEAGEEEE